MKGKVKIEERPARTPTQQRVMDALKACTFIELKEIGDWLASIDVPEEHRVDSLHMADTLADMAENFERGDR